MNHLHLAVDFRLLRRALALMLAAALPLVAPRAEASPPVQQGDAAIGMGRPELQRPADPTRDLCARLPMEQRVRCGASAPAETAEPAAVPPSTDAVALDGVAPVYAAPAEVRIDAPADAAIGRTHGGDVPPQ